MLKKTSLLSLVLITGVLSSVIVGCSGCANIDGFAQAAVKYLSDDSTQKSIEKDAFDSAQDLILTLKGKERTIAADAFFGAAKGLYANATGQPLSLSDFDGILAAYAPPLVKYPVFVNSALRLWNWISPSIDFSGSPDLVVTTLLSVARGWEKAAEEYRSK